MKHDFSRGMREVSPILTGIIPFALILGAQAGQKGMSALEVPMMMGLNFAGGSEFAAVGLWAQPLPVLLIWAMTFMINSRHILMGATMVKYWGNLPRKKICLALFFMTDESWALGIADAQRHQKFSFAYYFGVALSLYIVWVLFGWLGALIGPQLGNLEHLGFTMAFPAVFLVLMRGMWRGMRAARPWLVSLIVAALVYLCLPHSGWYVIVGTLAGLIYSYFWSE